MTFTTSATMRKMIEDWEGLVLVAAPDVVGVPTVGYGHTGPDVSNGMVITAERADELLSEDLRHFEVAVMGMAQNLNQQRFDALVSFSFNLGEGALHGSTLLRKNNAGDFEGAADEFLKWNHAGGVVYAGLTRRRQGERQMYLSGGSSVVEPVAPTPSPEPTPPPMDKVPVSDAPLAALPSAKAMQEFLIAQGYDCGPDGADGIWGQNTSDALWSCYDDIRKAG